MPLPAQKYPAVSHLLEIRGDEKNIVHWVDRFQRVALTPDVIIDLFKPALPASALAANANQGSQPLHVLGYDHHRRAAVIQIRATRVVYLCEVDDEQGLMTSHRVQPHVVTGYIGSRQFAKSIRRSVDVVGTAINWLEKRR